MKKYSIATTLIFAGVLFLVISMIELAVGFKHDTSLILGTMYILAAIICNMVATFSVPALKVTNHFKPEVIDLLEWSEKNIPKNNHPALCVDFVEELRKRFDVIFTSPVDEEQVTPT